MSKLTKITILAAAVVLAAVSCKKNNEDVGSSIKETEMLALNILNTFYGQNANSRGTAQAKAVLFFILVATIGLLQLSANRKKEVQQ